MKQSQNKDVGRPGPRISSHTKMLALYAPQLNILKTKIIRKIRFNTPIAPHAATGVRGRRARRGAANAESGAGRTGRMVQVQGAKGLGRRADQCPDKGFSKTDH